MFNERITKIVNKHEVVINDKPLPYHVSYMQYFYIAAHFMAIELLNCNILRHLIKNYFLTFKYDNLIILQGSYNVYNTIYLRIPWSIQR